MATSTPVSRRAWLQGVAAAASLLALPGLSLAGAATERRLVVVLLRGGVDGLALAPPHGDPAYREARRARALPPPGEEVHRNRNFCFCHGGRHEKYIFALVTRTKAYQTSPPAS